MKTKKLLLLLVTAGLVTVSCQKDDIETTTPEDAPIQDAKISKEVLAKIEALHFNPKDVELKEITFPNGEKKQSYIIEGDIAIDTKQLASMETGAITSKHYRTYNLVAT